MKKMFWPIPVIVLAIILLTVGTVGAWNMYTKSLDSQGRLEYTGEITITEIRAVSMTEVDVTVDSNDDTQSGVTYSIALFLDSVEAGTSPQTTSFTGGQLGGGSPRTLVYDTLDLTTVVSLDVEVTH